MKHRSVRSIILAFTIFACANSVAASTPPVHRFIDINAGKLAYRIFGVGNPVIVVNGGPGRASDTFIPLAEKLSENGHQVVLFDQRGTGASKLAKISADTVTLDLMIEDLELLRKQLGVGKVSILGHSFGGMYAMAYAAKYPANVKSMVLSASGGVDLSWLDYSKDNMLVRLSEEARERHRFWTSKEQLKKDPLKARLEALRLTIPAYVFQQKYAKEIEGALVNTQHYVPEVNDLVWRSMRDGKFNLRSSFKGFKAPTLIIDGRQDFLGEAVPLAIHDSIPGSRIEFLDQCSHYPWLDQPNLYFKLVNEFL